MDDEQTPDGNHQDLMQHIAASGENAGFIMQVNILIEDEDYWAYLLVPMEKYAGFMKAQEDEFCNIKDYGEIIEWGPGTEAPPHVLRQLEIDFGLTPRAADCLSDMAGQLGERMKHMGKRED